MYKVQDVLEKGGGGVGYSFLGEKWRWSQDEISLLEAISDS